MKPPKTLYACGVEDKDEPWIARKPKQLCWSSDEGDRSCNKCVHAIPYDLRETKGRAKK